MSNQLDRDYKELCEHILRFGVEKKDRTGTGTKSIFGWQIRHNMKTGFPLLTTKKMAWKQIVTELLWFLRGDTNIKYLVDNDCHIWDGDAYKRYINGGDIKWLRLIEVDTPMGKINIPTPYDKEQFVNKIKTDEEFAKKWGDLGPIYGKQWREWDKQHVTHVDDQNRVKYVTVDQIDQIQNLIKDLKTNPDSRRLMVNAWNVAELDQMVLPPCHYGFQVWTRELSLKERLDIWSSLLPDRSYNELNLNDIENTHIFLDGGRLDKGPIPRRAISLMWNQRSVDAGLGFGFNVASYSLLLIMIAKQVNMVPDEVIGNLGDVHLYLNHIEPIKEQLVRKPYDLPVVKISDRIVSDISEYTLDDFILENYQHHPPIKMPLSN